MDIIETLTETASWTKQSECYAKFVSDAQTAGHPIVHVGDAGYTSVSVQTGLDSSNNAVYRALPVGTVGIVPKNVSGQPDYSAQVTWLWDVPVLTPDNTFQIESLNCTLTGTSQTDYVRRPYPPEWDDALTMEDKEFNTAYQTPEFK